MGGRSTTATPGPNILSDTTQSHDRTVAMLLVATFVAIAALALYHLDTFPRTWFDEGMNLVAARSVVLLGRYGLPSSDGFRPFDTGVTTGPTMLLPVAAAFKIAGIGLTQARVVAVGFILIASAGFFSVARKIYGPRVALIALWIWMAATQIGPIAQGRQVLGEITALGFLYWGASVLIGAWNSGRTASFFAAGLLFGLAILTKAQFVMLLPVLVAVWFLVQRESKGTSFRQMVVNLVGAALPSALWYGYQYLVLGPGGFAAQLQEMSGVASASSYVFPFEKTLSALGFIASAGSGYLVVPALLYGWALLPRLERRQRRAALFPLAFASFWLGWYLVLSIGWPRYAIPVVLTSSIYIAKFVSDVVERFVPHLKSRLTLKGIATGEPLEAAVLLMFALIFGSGILTNAASVVRARDYSPQDFSRLVNDTVPADAVVESFEWEIDFLSDRRFHHPPSRLMNNGNAVAFLDASTDTLQWYRVPSSSTYLVDGPYSKVSRIYEATLAEKSFVRVASVGEYDLYERRSQ